MAKLVNEYLNQFKGQTINERILNDCRNYLLENKKVSPQQICLVHNTDQKTKEILGIGGSDPNDIINDNFGNWWRGLNRPLTSFFVTNVLLDNLNIARTLQILGVGGGFFSFSQNVVGSLIRIGSGSTPPARSDFNIETPFGTAPESGFVATDAGVYTSATGQGTYFGFYVAGGSGTVSEAATFMQWNASNNVVRQFMMARDLISPTVAFVAAQTISIQYIWQF